MLKKQLWVISQQTSHQEAIEYQAKVLYRKFVKEMKRAAHCGQTEIQAPTPHPDDYVQGFFLQMLQKDGLHVSPNGTVSWQPSASEEQVPILTARELVQAGYNPADGDLFKRILHALNQAIARGEVRNDLIQAQLIWVREHFKK